MQDLWEAAQYGVRRQLEGLRLEMGDPDSHSAGWTIMWTLKRALRSWIKPKDEYRPAEISDQVGSLAK